MVSINLTASKVPLQLIVEFRAGRPKQPPFPASTRTIKVEKSIKMSWSKTVVERRSARVKYGWEARFPRFFKAKGIAN
jgi:hypothetical protein